MAVQFTTDAPAPAPALIRAHAFSSHSNRPAECRHCKRGAALHASSAPDGVSTFQFEEAHRTAPKPAQPAKPEPARKAARAKSSPAVVTTPATKAVAAPKAPAKPVAAPKAKKVATTAQQAKAKAPAKPAAPVVPLAEGERRCSGLPTRGVAPHAAPVAGFAKNVHQPDGLMKVCRACCARWNVLRKAELAALAPKPVEAPAPVAKPARKPKAAPVEEAAPAA